MPSAGSTLLLQASPEPEGPRSWSQTTPRTHARARGTGTHGESCARPSPVSADPRSKAPEKPADVFSFHFRSSVRSSEIRRPSPPVLDTFTPDANVRDCRCRSMHPRRDKFKADSAAAISPGSRTHGVRVRACRFTPAPLFHHGSLLHNFLRHVHDFSVSLLL